MKCFYHHDMDGKCAGAIVYKRFERDEDIYDLRIYDLRTDAWGKGLTPYPSDYYAIDYKEEFPLNIIQPMELVIFVDYAIPETETFDKLLEITNNIIWIDHHATAIEKYKDYKIEGLRVDGVAGCELTWQYFYPDQLPPAVVLLLGDYDVWNFRYGDKTRHLQLGIQTYETNPEHENWSVWLRKDTDISSLLTAGEIITQYTANLNKNQIDSHAFRTAFGEFPEYTVIACNLGLTGSALFESVEEDFDLKVPFYYDGNKWTVSIYTDKPHIDCSKIATHYGGGGHKKAAGFTTKGLPFLHRAKYEKRLR